MVNPIISRPNLPYIVRFGPYHPHGFVLGYASPSLIPTPQNAYNMLATNMTHKALAYNLKPDLWSQPGTGLTLELVLSLW